MAQLRRDSEDSVQAMTARLEQLEAAHKVHTASDALEPQGIPDPI